MFKFRRPLGSLLVSMVIVAGAMAQSTVKVPKIALMWCYAENESGTSEAGMKTSNDLLQKLFEEKAGYEVIPYATSRAAWKETGLSDVPSSVEDPANLPKIPTPKELLEFGKKAGVDFVCVGTVNFHVKSIWVTLGPKTKADATVNTIIVDVNKAEIALQQDGINSNDTKAEKWYETAGALLLTWGITVFSGGPKTPRIQEAAVKAIGLATDPYFVKTANPHIQ